MNLEINFDIMNYKFLMTDLQIITYSLIDDVLPVARGEGGGGW